MAIFITSHFSLTCLQILRISDLAIGMYASYSRRTTVFPKSKIKENKKKTFEKKLLIEINASKWLTV